MPAPPLYPPAEIERILSPIALYPDPLLAQVLAASTFSPDIPAAARWADQHHYLVDTALTSAIAADRLPWDPSVQALLPLTTSPGQLMDIEGPVFERRFAGLDPFLESVVCIESEQREPGQPHALLLAAGGVDDDLAITVDLVDPEA